MANKSSYHWEHGKNPLERGSRATAAAKGSVLQFDGTQYDNALPLEFGEATTAATIMGSGTSASPTAQTSGTNMLGFWGTSSAATGDSRAAYLRMYFTAAGGGEALRAYGTVNNATAAVGGTVNGAHISLSVTGASGAISGAGHALRATLDLGAATDPGGTIDVLQLDTNIAADATIPAKTPYIRVTNVGTGKLDYLLAVGASPSTTMFAAAGTGANSAGVTTGGVAAKVLKVDVGGTDYWLPLFSSNADA